MAEQHRADAEAQLVDDHDAVSADDEAGFDRSRQGAPRSDDTSRYSGQSAYGSLEKTASKDELAASTQSCEPAGQKGDFGEGNYGGEAGDSERGGLSSYGNSSGSRYVIDNELNTMARTKVPALSHPGAAVGAAPQSSNPGQYAGEYDDQVGDPLQQAPFAERRSETRAPLGTSPSISSARNDASQRIHEQIAARLLERSEVELRDISVTVHQGRVTLKGTVPEPRDKQIIDEIADNVDGVLAVDSQIEVRRMEEFATSKRASEEPPGHPAKPAADAANSTTPANTGAPTFGAASADAKRKKQADESSK